MLIVLNFKTNFGLLFHSCYRGNSGQNSKAAKMIKTPIFKANLRYTYEASPGVLCSCTSVLDPQDP